MNYAISFQGYDLHAFMRPPRKPKGSVMLADVQREVVRYFELRMSDMTSQRRARDVARPRQIAMYLSKQLTPRSLPDIGRRFGNRDHTTVIHAIRQIEKLCASDAEIARDVEIIRNRLEAA